MTTRPSKLPKRLLASALAASSLTLLAFANVQPPKASSPRASAPKHATPPTDDLAAELNRRLTQDVLPLISTYCLSCHSGDDAKGDVHLDQLKSLDDALAGDLDIRLIKEMVGTAAMPPKPKPGKTPSTTHPVPSDHQRLIITQWTDAVSNYTPADAPIDPGWFTIHRLNRTEYRNTLRDLLGIDPAKLDLAAKLPRDDTGYGFDNIADVLSTSPLAVEQYLAAAEQAIDTALGPIVEFGDTPRTLRPLEGKTGQPLPKGGFSLYSNGPASAKFTAPLTGDYLIRIRAWETHAGDEPSRMSLDIDKRKLKEFAVSGTREDPQEFQLRTRLLQGEQTIAANFLNDFYIKDKADRNLGVESISVAGPLDEATAERPTQWKTIFAPGAAIKDEAARAKAILTAFATRAYRRPATDAQSAALLKLYRAQRKAGQAHEPAIRTALAATLVSPNFLFRSAAIPKANASNPGASYTLDGYELASRLSYFLWSSPPDEPLLAAAADGSLLTDAVLSAQTRRMIADPRSSAFVENFAGQWLQLRALDNVAIDRTKFPDYNDQLRADMITEATLFLGDTLKSDRSIIDFINCRDTFLNQRLAEFYGVPGVKGSEFRRVTLPENSPRGGVLTMGAILTLTSNTTRTSPVKRGLFVLDQILGAPPPPPPADIPPLDQAHTENPDATVRERLAIHVANPTCAACHNRLDPIGLSFEHFDAIGHWRDTENGKPIDATGTLPDQTNLNGAGDLKKTLLARSDQFVEALTAKTLTYALARGTEPFDRPAIRQIAQRTRANNDKFSALIESITLSESFRTCRPRNPKTD